MQFWKLNSFQAHVSKAEDILCEVSDLAMTHHIHIRRCLCCLSRLVHVPSLLSPHTFPRHALSSLVSSWQLPTKRLSHWRLSESTMLAAA